LKILRVIFHRSFFKHRITIMLNIGFPIIVLQLLSFDAIVVTSFDLRMSSSSPTGGGTGLRRVAIVGGGVAGCAAARQLAKESAALGDAIDVTVFDWGRSVGKTVRQTIIAIFFFLCPQPLVIPLVGGRSSHRCRPEPLGDNDGGKHDVAIPFDHGAQFFHATDKNFLDMVRPAVTQWPYDLSRLGWLDKADGSFESSKIDRNSKDGFFGACDRNLDGHRFVGVGGMNAICNELLRGAKELAPGRVHIHEGTRVAKCERIKSTMDGKDKVWKLYGDALGHEQANAKAIGQSTQQLFGEFDELVVSDHMALSMPSWHPCHILGIEDEVPDLVSSIRQALDWDESSRRFRAIKPLFSCMVALPVGLELNFDAASVKNSEVLQWVCAQKSRPHEVADDTISGMDRWVLVSTVDFATRCLGAEGMSKPSSGSTIEYIPQTDEYLRSDPADLMWEEFKVLVESTKANIEVQTPLFLKCQRWGAAFCEVTGTQCSDITNAVRSHENDQSITVCGDFMHILSDADDSAQTTKFTIQNAALSGVEAALRIIARSKNRCW